MIKNISCPLCGKKNLVKVDPIGYDLWVGGELIQVALPELSVDERELLISGICSDCW